MKTEILERLKKAQECFRHIRKNCHDADLIFICSDGIDEILEAKAEIRAMKEAKEKTCTT